MPHERSPLDPDTVRAWQRIAVDFGIAAVAFFLFIYAALTVREPTVLAIMFGAGATLLGLPAARRVDESRNRIDKEANDITERWSGLP